LAQKAFRGHLADHHRRREYFGLPRDRTVIMGSRITV